MLSLGRSEMNSVATCLAASRRLGLRSSANIVPEISIAIMMSIPSVDSLLQRLLSCGLARQTVSRIIAAHRSKNGRCSMYRRAVRGCFPSTSVEAICRLASLLCNSRRYQKITGASRSSKNS